jgi:hypothetical protein
MNYRKLSSRLTLPAAALLALGLAFTAAQRPVPAVHAQAIVPHESCCGAITPAGYRLATMLDSMDVEHNWLAHEHVDWETGKSDRPADFKGHDMATHCSAFAAAVGERLDIYMLRPPDHPQTLLASAQAEWFHGHDGVRKGWLPLEGPGHEQRAQELANQGNLAVIVYESPDPHKPGHIAIVRPSEKSADALRTEGPQIAQAGAQNHNSSIAALSFTHHPGAWPNGVRYYWHPVDWSSIPAASFRTSTK